MSFGNLTMEDAITFYFQKYDAIRRGDFALVKQLKEQCPDIFNEKIIHEIESFINYLTILQLNPDFQKRYEAFKRQKAKEKFKVIS